MGVIDINDWYNRLHRNITGNMALRFVKVTPADLQRWATELHAIANEMAATASAPGDAAGRKAPPDTDAQNAEHGKR